MSDALEQAAAAFDTAMGNSAPAAREPSSESRPAEQMFEHVGDLEVDEESPAKGGGDDDLPSKVRPQVAKEFQDAVDEDDTGENQPEDEDQVGDDDAPEEDADEQGGDEDEGQEGDDDVYEVVIDGERKEVPLREALDGYIRQETFHQRMNELNEVKVAIRNEAIGVMEDRRKYVGLIDKMQEQLEAMLPKEPDWDAEYAADPVQARALEKRFQEIKSVRANLEAERARVNREQQERDAEDTKKYIESENKRVMANNPSWKDEKVMKRDLNSMYETGRKAGFSDEEIKTVYDSRMVAILLKAAKYDRLQANKPKPIRKGTKPTRPGAGSTRTAPKGSQAMKQLSRTGSVDAAAQVFAGIIDPKPRRR